MTVGLKPEHWDRFQALARKHNVECANIGNYTDSGKVHLLYQGKTCAYVDLDFLQSDFPKWTFEAEWQEPAARGLSEPVIKEPEDYPGLLKTLLSRPNIASKNWIARQYDHEVQGGSVLKPLVGKYRISPAMPWSSGPICLRCGALPSPSPFCPPMDQSTPMPWWPPPSMRRSAGFWWWAVIWSKSAEWIISAGPASNMIHRKTRMENTRPPNWCGPTGP